MEILILVVVVLGIPLWVLPLVNARWRKRALQELALRWRLDYKPATSGLFRRKTPSHVAGIHYGRRFMLSTIHRSWMYHGMHRGPIYTVRYMEVEVANRGNAQLVLLSAAQEVVLLKTLIGRQSARTGDEQIDRRFFIERSTPKDLVVKLSASSYLRQRFLDVLSGMRRRRIELNGQRLRLQETLPWYYLESVSSEVNYLQRLIDLMVDIR